MSNLDTLCKTKITFIIPTIGRSTLQDSINSLLNQTNSNWKAIIVFDGIDPTLTIDDARITMIKSEKLGIEINSAGNVRNFGINLAETEWVAFLDDDDAVKNTYVEIFYNELLFGNNDIIIFRMKGWVHTEILPRHECNNFYRNEVGISFAAKKLIFDSGTIFIPSDTEDYCFLDDCRRKGYKIMISPYLLYFLRNYNIDSYEDIISNRVFINCENICKNGHMFLIKNNNPALEFWRNVYPSFNQELYKTFDSIESKDKTIIDIGYSVALTTIYLSRISEKVHTINCNKNNSEKTTNIKNIIRDNCSNVTIFDGDFGNNITFCHLINYLNDNNINFNNLSFININLNGLEENFMQNFYEFQKNIKVPIIIQLYLSNWNDKNVSRFPFLNNFEIFDNCVIVLS
jgi:glycosyltransferase involved in cell wall biosynthesis